MRQNNCDLDQVDHLSFSNISSTQERLELAREEQDMMDRQYEELYKSQ